LLKDKDFLLQHGSKSRLTSNGREQAIRAGNWLRDNVKQFDFCFTSEYGRALETAALLNITEERQVWRIQPYLHERDWGDLDRMDEEMQQQLYSRNLVDFDGSPYFWRPPNGESLITTCVRLKHWLGTLARECSQKTIIAVCHGEVLEALSIELERVSEHDFIAHKQANQEVINNCDIVHYTRFDSNNDLSDFICRKRIIRLADPQKSAQQFVDIQRKEYSSEQLLEIVKEMPTFFE
jgi:broad specificity phosphatase PhoE